MLSIIFYIVVILFSTLLYTFTWTTAYPLFSFLLNLFTKLGSVFCTLFSAIELAKIFGMIQR